MNDSFQGDNAKMVNIEIDGKKVKGRDGAMLIEAADEAGIAIPRFCYHKKLSVAANCRMCLVEVEKAAKPLPACATPVTEGMKVYTKSPKAIDAQRGVMEFLLINHPLDCPICDQGGECDLQDLAMGYGAGQSRYGETKRVVKDKDIGPLVSTDMTRCIHCTRCVRFGQEVAGIRELGATGRGEHMKIETYVSNTVTSELSGNVIDLCPVGALTSKPFRFHARSWEMSQTDGVSPHDCVGSNVTIEALRSEVRRVVARENESINETWISDRDRFGYEGVNSADRLRQPMIKRDGQWEACDWETALDVVAQGLKAAVEKHSAARVGALVSPSSTLEEMYLLQKLMRGLGSGNIDYRLRQLDFSHSDQLSSKPVLGCGIEALEHVDAALLIGSNVRFEQPMIGHRLRKAAMRGAKLTFINPVDFDFRFAVHAKSIVAPAAMAQALAAVAKALLDAGVGQVPDGLATLVENVQVDEHHRAIADALRQADKPLVLMGSNGLAHPAYGTLQALAQAIGAMVGAPCGLLSDGANGLGAWLAGAVPHSGPAGKGASFGLTAGAMLTEQLPAYVLLGVEPEHDCGQPAVAMQALNNAEFVVAMSPYRTETMLQYASVVLPTAPVTETSGTFVNVEGQWQSFQGSVKGLGDTRPAWKVLRVLGNLLSQQGFDYVSSEDVREELRQLSDQADKAFASSQAWTCPESLAPATETLQRFADMPMYGVDGVVRRAASLQNTPQAIEAAKVRINSTTAQACGLNGAERVTVRQGESTRVLPLAIDERVADHCVWLSAGNVGVAGFGANGASVELKPA